MKRIVALLLSAVLALGLAACGKKEAGASSAPLPESSSAASAPESLAASQPESEAASVPESLASSQPESEAASVPEAPSSEAEPASEAAASAVLPADSAAAPALGGVMELEGGSAQGGATPFALDQKNHVAVNGRRLWFSFTTGAETDYQVMLAPDGQYYRSISFTLFDEMGKELWAIYTNEDGSVTAEQVQLNPHTTYYITLSQSGGNSGSVTFRLGAAAAAAAELPPESQPEPEPEPELVFEEPFELNETQVMFVSNQAVFVSEEDAKAALEPVAEIILANPDHPILLAGTTATDGEQDSCVKLSQQRAEAVKNLLVSAFGVPEDQLLTVGLGFEKDPFPRGKDRDGYGQFVESEAAKNRRVMVMDANDPIAQQILAD